MRLRILNNRGISTPALSAVLFIGANIIASNSMAATASMGGAIGFDELIKQGRAAFLASDLDRAEAAYNEACPAELVKAYPVARSVICGNLLASVDEARGNLNRAEQRYLQAVVDAEQAGSAYQPLYCGKLIDLGEYYHRRGRVTEAEASLQKAMDLARKVASATPELLPEALIRLGGLYAGTTRPERGRPLLMEAFGITEAFGILPATGGDGKSPMQAAHIAYAHDALGLIEMAAGNHREAESHFRQATTLATTVLGEDQAITLGYQTNLALELMSQRQFERAKLLLRRAQFVLESRRKASGVEVAVICAALSNIAGSQGKYAEAEDYAQRAISILNLQPHPDVHAIAAAQVTLAAIYLRSHDVASAEKILPQAVEVQRATDTSSNTMAASIQLLAELRAQQRNWTAAEVLYREAIAIYEKGRPAGINPAAAPLMRALASLLKQQGGSKDEARALESRARDILRSLQAGSPAISVPRG